MHDASADGDATAYGLAAAVLTEVRKAKTTSQRSLRTDAEVVSVTASAETLGRLRPVLDDVQEAARARAVELVEDADAETPTVVVTLVAPGDA